MTFPHFGRLWEGARPVLWAGLYGDLSLPLIGFIWLGWAGQMEFEIKAR